MTMRNRRSILAAMGAAAIGVSFGGEAGAARGKTLNFYDWDTYIGDTTLDDFHKATGVTVNMQLFASNDELYSRLKAKPGLFDVVVPSDAWVPRLVDAGMLRRLDHSRLPNLRNVVPELLDPPYDPGCRYSVPYTCLVIGIGYHKSKMRDGMVPDSWKWVFDSDAYSGRIALMASAEETMRLGAKYLGHSLNGLKQADVDAVVDMLIRQKPHVIFHNDEGDLRLLKGDVDLVVEYNGDIAQVALQDDDIAFVIPREGSQRMADTWAIPAGAPHVDNAYAFLNFMLDGQAGAEIARTLQYPTPNAAARALLKAGYRDSPILFPPAAQMATCEYQRWEGIDHAMMVDAAMQRVRNA